MAELGRPTVYRTEYVAQVAKLCVLGATDQELADFFEVDVRTIYRWKAEYPDFCQAIKSAKEPADDRVERSLYHRATGYSHDDVDIRAIGGEVVQTPIRKQYPPDAASAIFWLKNRRPDQWRERAEPTKVELEVTFRRDPDRFGLVIDQEPEDVSRAKTMELIAKHPPEVQEHLRLVLQDVPDEALEGVYKQAIGAILATSHRGQGEEAPDSLLERQQIQRDVTEAGSGYMANLDEEQEEEKARLEDAQKKVEAHNRKLKKRTKR